MSTKQEKPKLMVQNVSCIIPQTDTLGGLYVGNTYGADNPQILQQYGIRAVLTTSIQTPQSYNPIQIPFHLKISAHDKSDYEIIEHLQQCLEFIHKYRQITNVFVHCYAGVSRSVTVVVAYLMRYWGWGLRVAVAFVQAKRVVAKPNDGFMEQLKRFQDSLYKQNTNNTHTRPSSALVSTQYKSQQLKPTPTTQPHQPQHSPLQSPKQPHPIPTLQNRHSYQQPPTLSQIRNEFQLTTPVNPIAPSKKHSQTPIPRILTNNNVNSTNKAHLDRKEGLYSPTSSYHVEKYHSNSMSHVKMVSGSQGQYSNNYPHYYNPNYPSNYPNTTHNPSHNTNNTSSNNTSQIRPKNSIFGSQYNNSNSNSNSNSNNYNGTSNSHSHSTSISQNKSSKVLIRPKDLPGYKN